MLINLDTAIWDSDGDVLEYDDEGFCVNEYVVVGSEEPSPYYAMIMAWATA